MTQQRSILIRNVYYMLAYAFQTLRSRQYERVETEAFEHVHDFFATILEKGISRQLKQGLHREYVTTTDALMTVRGKISMPETIRLRSAARRELACEYDELSEDNLLNQILRATALLLLRHGKVSAKNRAALRKELMFFSDVADIDLRAVKWSTLRFSRNNQSYQMLTGICQLVVEGLLLTTESGEQKLMSFVDDQAMSRLYEKFILEYYRNHWPILRPRAAQIQWALEAGERTLLPTMQSDISLTYGDQVLIIDAKYYSKNLQDHFGNYSVHSANLYQIFTYVKNKQAGSPEKEVAGTLLYARTSHDTQPKADWLIGGSRIAISSLDLNRPFVEIAEQLDQIVCSAFDLSPLTRVA